MHSKPESRYTFAVAMITVLQCVSLATFNAVLVPVFQREEFSENIALK